MRASRKLVSSAIVGTLAVLALTVPGQAQTINACSGAKNKCVGKKAASRLKCHEKAEAKGSVVDSTCLAKADVKFSAPGSGCIAKAEAKYGGSCLTLGDTVPLETEVDSFVDYIVGQLDPSYPTPVTNLCSSAKK